MSCDIYAHKYGPAMGAAAFAQGQILILPISPVKVYR